MDTQDPEGINLEQEMEVTDATQPSEFDMTPEEAKAALGIGTRMQEGILMQNAPVESQDAQGAEETQEPEESLDDAKEELRKEFKSMIDEKFATLKEDLMSALNEDDEKEQD